MGLLAGVALAGGPALAQDTGDPGPMTNYGQNELGASAEAMFDKPETYFARDNLTLQLGGGFSEFTDGGTDQLVGTGGSWILRGIFGADQAIGLEGAYVGAAYPITALSGDQGTLVSNGVEVMARLGYPFRRDEGFVMPYLGAGTGFTIYNAGWLDEATSGIDDSDVVFNLPIAAGIGAGYGRFSVDVRFTYRPTWGSSMFNGASDTTLATGLGAISFAMMAGYKF
jgi:hypothetical protein